MNALDKAYTERAHLVALLAHNYPAYKTPALDVSEDGWWLVFLYVATQQLSWHIAPHDAYLFGDVPTVEPDDWHVRWDGHTTPQKYARIRQMLKLMA